MANDKNIEKLIEVIAQDRMRIAVLMELIQKCGVSMDDIQEQFKEKLKNKEFIIDSIKTQMGW